MRVSGWKVELRPAASRAYRQLAEDPRRDATGLLVDLAEDPALIPAIEPRANPGTWRARFHQDRYRVISQIAKIWKHILVTRIRPRPTAYEGTKR
jgi:mRNA-degrading endonuclease RelE of RelBE toxin-antitoxin system